MAEKKQWETPVVILGSPELVQEPDTSESTVLTNAAAGREPERSIVGLAS